MRIGFNLSNPSGGGAAAFVVPSAFTIGFIGGTLSNDALTELSGITYSNKSNDYLWAAGDSGSPQDIYPIRWNGDPYDTVDVTGATNTDWEDMSAASVGGNDYIYISESQVGDDVEADAGNDEVYITNGAQIGSDVELGSGDDFLSWTGGYIEDEIRGGSGSDEWCRKVVPAHLLRLRTSCLVRG